MTSVSAPAPAASAGSEQPCRAVDHDVFIVHADEDTPFVRGELLPMLNLAVDRVILSSELPFPAFTEQAIEDSVRRSRLTIAVISPAYLRDRWAGFAELLSRNVHDDGRGGRLVPLVIAECEVPSILRQHATRDARTPQQREAAAVRLRERLGRPDPEAASLACPYPGMRPFSAAMAARFHGREREIESVLGRLHAGEREIYVIGPSGSGKSSLIAAGVLPRVQDAAASERFAVRSVRPGERPTQRLAEALGCEPVSFDGAVGRLLERERCDRLLIFIDQLEELFTLADAEERDRLVRALRVLRADRRCHLIAALRADFYGALMSSDLWPDIEGRFTRLEVAPLRGDALRRAIEAPAFEAGVYLERGLVERLISDAAAEPGALPLLQEALVLLWARRSHRLLRLASYEALDADAHDLGAPRAEAPASRDARPAGARSGIAVALARRADAALHDLTRAEQRVAQPIFLRLVSFGEGRPDTRRQQPRAALASCGTGDAAADPVIDRLIDARLLTSDATLRGEPLIDLAHEALIAGWPKLQHWLLSRRDDEQRRRLLELHAAQWVQRERGNVGLFDSIELAEAQRWIAGDTARELGFSEDLPRFLAASRDAIAEAERQRQLAAEQQERERRAAQKERMHLRRRLVRLAMVALALIAIVTSSIGLLAWRQREEAERQRHEAERQRQEAQHQLVRNELEQARSLVVERRDSPSAIPHLVELSHLGVDTAVLRTLLTAAGRDLWRFKFRHGGRVMSASFSPDGARVVTASADGTARMWDATTGNPLGLPLKHESAVRSAAFSADGARVVTASDDGTARVWDAATGNPLGAPLKHEQAVRSAAFSPDGARVVTASDDGTARVWDAATGNPLGVPLKHGSTVVSASFSPDGARVVTASPDGARVWDATTGNPLGAPLKYALAVHRAAFSPDGARVVTASLDGTARVWDAATGNPLGAPLKHGMAVWSAAFSPDGARVVTASLDGTARVWDAATGNPLGVPLKHESAVNSAAFSPDGARVVTASADGTARVWNAATGNPLGVPLQHESAVSSAAFSPDGARVVTASNDGTARVWDAAAGNPLGVPLKHEEAVNSAAFSPDGARVVTASADGTARVWDAATGNPLGVPLKHGLAVWSAAFSPDGTRVVTASNDGTARVWDAATGNPLSVPFRHESAVKSAVNSAVFSPDGARVVTASADGTARVWDAATGNPLGTPLKHESAVKSAAFSPDGARVVTASADGTARVWDAATGNPLAVPLKHEQAVWSAAFSADGARVVTASDDGTAQVWDAATGNPLGVPLKHGLAVWSAAFSPDGTRVVTASNDGTARVWDAATGNPLGVPLKHESWLKSAAFSPDGTRVVTASNDGTARVWDAATGNPLGVPLKHESRVMSAVFSPDGARVVTASLDGTAWVWQITATGPLDAWLQQVRSCLVQPTEAVGSSHMCQLGDRPATAADLVTRARALVASGDRAMHGRVWSAPRARYLQALSLLDPCGGSAPRQELVTKLCRWISTRLAIVAAVEGRVAEARTRLGPDAPETDAMLLAVLGGIVHEELHDEDVAVALLRRAHEQDPGDPSILANLAETYFASGQAQQFAGAAAQINARQGGLDVRVAIAALRWAGGRFTPTTTAAAAGRLLSVYREAATAASLQWAWDGTKHALTYGRHRFEDVKPIIDVLSLLEQPVTDATRAQLAKLLAAPTPALQSRKN